MIAGQALGVGRAVEELADGGTPEHAQRVCLAHLVRGTLAATSAGRHRGHFTLTSQGVSHMGGRTLTCGPVVLHIADLIVSAAHDLAGVNTGPLATDVDATHMVGGTVILSFA